MKAVKLMGNGKAIMVEAEKPKPPEGYVLIKVAAAGICRTDIELLYHSPEPLEVFPGHEAVGILEDPNGAEGFSVGDRVLVNCHIVCGTCRHCKNEDRIFCKDLKVIGFDVHGAVAEYLIVPKENITKIPDDITFEQAVLLTDALGTPYNGVKKAGIKPGDKVGVIGVGPLGIMCVLCAKYFNGEIIALDMLQHRLEQSKKFGASHTINPSVDNVREEIDKLTDGIGLDIVIECSGSAKAIKMGLDLLKERGTLLQLGVCTDVSINTFDDLICKELTIIGSRGFVDSEIPEIIDLIRKSPNIGDVISHRFKLEDAQEAFDMAENRNGIKVIFTP